MKAIVRNPGLHALIVDEGRSGARALGIGPSGPMDIFAFMTGNFLAGNAVPAPAIEFFLPAPEIYFEDSALVAVTGPGLSVLVNEKIISAWKPFLIPPKSTLKIITNGDSICGYICVNNGWNAQEWLNSKTTSLAASMGGLNGRLLKKDDLLVSLQEQQLSAEDQQLFSDHMNWQISEKEIHEVYFQDKHICCVRGPEAGKIGEPAEEAFVSGRFRISAKSNRMGYRLTGPPLINTNRLEMVSSAVDFGTIQLLPDGQLIVLMADHQTTGGYPRIATVIHADLPGLAQFNRKKDISFTWCCADTAYQIAEERSRRLNEIKNSCLLQLNQYLPWKNQKR